MLQPEIEPAPSVIWVRQGEHDTAAKLDTFVRDLHRDGWFIATEAKNGLDAAVARARRVASSIACGAISMDTLLHGFITATARLGLDYRFLLDDYERVPFVQGLGVSIEIIVSTMTAAPSPGSCCCSRYAGATGWIAGLARGFIEVTRNTPTLVQLYCAFLVLNMLITQWLHARGIDNPFKPFFWVVLVLSLHKAAFHAEALRAGFDALPSQTLEGAASLGFSRATRFWRIELPLALRAALAGAR